MSFTSKEHIQRLIEGLLHYSWPEDLGSLTLPFPEMSFKDAINNYGVDKPDTRFSNTLLDITETVLSSEIARIFASLSESSDFAAIAVVFNDSAVFTQIVIYGPSDVIELKDLTTLLFVFLQNLLTKAAEEALMKSAREANDRSSSLSFVAVRIGADGKWRSSLTKKLTEPTMSSISHKLGASPNDVVFLGLGRRESLVSTALFMCCYCCCRFFFFCVQKR